MIIEQDVQGVLYVLANNARDAYVNLTLGYQVYEHPRDAEPMRDYTDQAIFSVSLGIEEY